MTITLLLFPRHTGFGHFIFSSYPRFGQKSPENQIIKNSGLNIRYDPGALSRFSLSIETSTSSYILSEKHIYSRKKSLATPDCFTPYLVNVESKECCCICLETAFISEEFCVKSLAAFAAAGE